MTDRFTRASFLAQTSALALAAQPAFAAGALTPLNIGNLPDVGSADASYAYDNGYFKDVGLDAHITFLNNGNSVYNAVVGGSIDIGTGNVGSLAVARSRGLPLRAVAPGFQAEAAPNFFIMVQKDSPIRSGADFNNKIVAEGALKTVAEAIFRMWVDKNGGDSNTIRFVEVPFPAMADAVEARRADVALVADPFATMAREKNNVLPVNFYSVLPLPILITCFVASETWLAANAESAKKFAAGIRRAAIWANGHPKESNVLLAKITKMDPKLIDAMSVTHYATGLEPARMQPVVDAMLKYGLLDKRIEAKDLIWSA